MFIPDCPPPANGTLQLPKRWSRALEALSRTWTASVSGTARAMCSILISLPLVCPGQTCVANQEQTTRSDRVALTGYPVA